jgi:hypothetical protein
VSTTEPFAATGTDTASVQPNTVPMAATIATVMRVTCCGCCVNAVARMVDLS